MTGWTAMGALGGEEPQAPRDATRAPNTAARTVPCRPVAIIAGSPRAWPAFFGAGPTLYESCGEAVAVVPEVTEPRSPAPALPTGADSQFPGFPPERSPGGGMTCRHAQTG